MTKRLVSLALIVMMMATLISTAAVAESGTTMYVRTDNGKSLNVRDKPDGKVVSSFKYGQAIYVEYITASGWAQTYYGDNGDTYTGWVSARYLVKSDPGKYVPSNNSAPASSNTDAAKALSDMNAEFKTGKLVTNQFTVYSRPSRASGWVNLRWAPSTETERIATCPQGKALTVIGETKNWYQVQDPHTGMVGFIMKKFVATR